MNRVQIFGTPQISPSAPSFEDVYTAPIIPRGLTHGMNQEPITPPGASRDSHLLDIQPLRKFPVRSREQRSIPNLVDISWVNGDTLVALDKRNKSVVVLSDRGDHLNSSFFKFEPYSCTGSKPGYGGGGSSGKSVLEGAVGGDIVMVMGSICVGIVVFVVLSMVSGSLPCDCLLSEIFEPVDN
jgi:hypothetical protein